MNMHTHTHTQSALCCVKVPVSAIICLHYDHFGNFLIGKLKLVARDEYFVCLDFCSWRPTEKLLIDYNIGFEGWMLAGCK